MQHSEDDTRHGRSRANADDDTPAFTMQADLASARVGGRALYASDDFFAPRANLLKPEPAIFVPRTFTPRGKWLDGWASRRKRSPGHAWCVCARGARGRVACVEVETSFSVGNFPSPCSRDARDTSRVVRPRVGAREG